MIGVALESLHRVGVAKVRAPVGEILSGGGVEKPLVRLEFWPVLLSPGSH